TLAADYHLQSGSPCRDAGNPDPADNDPDGTRADMGCYYFLFLYATAALNPSSLDFPTVEPEHPETLSVALENAGNTALQVTEVTVNPPFSVVSYPLSVAPRSSEPVVIAFDPPGNGQFRDTLRVVSNALNDDTVTAALSGIGEVGLQPGPVHDLVVWAEGADGHLCWSSVNTSMQGNPIAVDYYLVYYGQNSGGPFFFHGYTADTCYVHAGVVQFAPSMFYEVTAYIGSIGSVLSIVEDLGGKATREEIAARLQP
ncbi:MAG: hypothetical protein PHI18_02345, partial [bacterium]|nr:hypothetical protein [bacterium]